MTLLTTIPYWFEVSSGKKVSLCMYIHLYPFLEEVTKGTQKLLCTNSSLIGYRYYECRAVLLFYSMGASFLEMRDCPKAICDFTGRHTKWARKLCIHWASCLWLLPWVPLSHALSCLKKSLNPIPQPEWKTVVEATVTSPFSLARLLPHNSHIGQRALLESHEMLSCDNPWQPMTPLLILFKTFTSFLSP